MSQSVARTSKKSKPRSGESTYPAPFDKAPAALEPFVAQLDPAQIYITHIDRHRPDYKKQIFLFAVLVNTTITFLLAWRLYIAVPKYIALARTIFGYASSAMVDISSTTRKQQLAIIIRRTAMMVSDYLLFRYIGPWPLSFFAERPSNPVTWRWKIRFQPQEVVVRVCRNWTGEDLMNSNKKGGESPFFKTRIAPAIEPRFMEKTAYLMMDGNWDLDFGLMEDAHVLLKQEKIKSADLDKVVLAHQKGSGWLAWNFRVEDSGARDVVAELRKVMEHEGGTDG